MHLVVTCEVVERVPASCCDLRVHNESSGEQITKYSVFLFYNPSTPRTAP